MAEELRQVEAQARARLLDGVSYDVLVDLTDGSGNPGELTFRSRTVVRFACREPGGSTHVDVTAPVLRSAVLNGTEVSDYDGHRLQLTGLAAANELVVEADMAYMNTGAGVHRFVDPADGGVYLYTQFEAFDAHRMYACFDQPDLKATFRLTVHAPRDWVVVSNGAVVEAPPMGHAGVWRFAETPVVPTYITALVAGPFAHVHDEHDGIALGLYCRRSIAEHLDADEVFSLTKQGFDFYHREFATRYPFEKYDQLFVAEMSHGAMENAGAVTITDSLVFRSKVTESDYELRATVILHELAHMWFGNLVTMQWWDDLWLNESFATYASIVCMVESTPYQGGWTTLANEAKTTAYGLDQLATSHPVAADAPDLETVRVNFDAITYAKGAAVLKQLVAWVGRDAFREGVRAYFREHAWGSTTLRDLLRALERSSGRDLSAWSALWLETAGVNTLRPLVEVDDRGVITRLAIRQEATPEWPTLRPHRLAVGCYDVVDGALVRTLRVELDVEGETTEVDDLVGLPRPALLLLLLNDDDLAYAKVRLDEHSSRTLAEHAGRLDHSLPRALCWGASWDMTREGEMAARDYLTIVRGGIAFEQDIGMVQTLLRQAGTALDAYAAPDWSATGRAALAEDALRAVLTSTPGGDHQLVWAQTAVETATAPEHVRWLLSLLDGSGQVLGLAVDQDLRWRLVRRLAALGVLQEQDIDREEERDDTAVGRQQAAACRAARPTAEAKEQAWACVVQADDLSQVVQLAVVSGFAQPEQTDLLEPFVERYFAAVGDLWHGRDPQLANGLVVGLYPRTVVSHEVVRRTDAFLADGDVPAPLARLLTEGREGVSRALRARQRDAAQASLAASAQAPST